MLAHGLPDAAEHLRMLKAAGFSDARLAKLAKLTEAEVRQAEAVVAMLHRDADNLAVASLAKLADWLERRV